MQDRLRPQVLREAVTSDQVKYDVVDSYGKLMGNW